MPEEEAPLCEFCSNPIPARRLKMKGAAKNFCRQNCVTEWMDAEFAEDDSLDDPNEDQESVGPTLQEVMESPDYTPAQKIAFAAAWGTKKVWDAFKKERPDEFEETTMPQPAEVELTTILLRLRLPANATQEMVSDRRREFAKRYHPDRAGPAGEAMMKKINGDVDAALKLMEQLGRP